MSVDKMVAAYIRIRETVVKKEEEIASLKEDMNSIASEILTLCKDQGVDGFKTPYGTVSRRVQKRYWTSDWEAMYAFIRENDAFQLLEKRVHNMNMKEFLEENPELLPQGLQSDSKYVLHIRKSTNR